MSADSDITPEDRNDSISIEEGEHVQMFEGSEGLDVPPVFSVQEQANLKELTLLYKSFKKVREWADNGEKGYHWEDGILMHEVDDQLDGTITRIVVPIPFSDTALKLVHEHSGYLSIHKMRTLLGKFYAWTGIHVYTMRHYSACPECQRVSRRRPKVAPLQEVPVIQVRVNHSMFGLQIPGSHTFEGDKCRGSGRRYARNLVTYGHPQRDHHGSGYPIYE